MSPPLIPGLWLVLLPKEEPGQISVQASLWLPTAGRVEARMWGGSEAYLTWPPAFFTCPGQGPMLSLDLPDKSGQPPQQDPPALSPPEMVAA